MTDQSATSQLPYKAVIFDLYGTLIDAPRGGVRPDPDADPSLLAILQNGKWRAQKEIALPEDVMASPSTALHQAIRSHHRQSTHPHPEVDLRALWKTLLKLPDSVDAGQLVIELHSAWNPITWMAEAREAIQRASRAGLVLGLLSNAQYDTLVAIRPMNNFFHHDLVLFSYQYGVAKPSPVLFEKMQARLAALHIRPEEVLYIGNDPNQDIEPARQAGFRPLLFDRDPDVSRHPAAHRHEILSDWRNFLPESSS